jgi:hypothetical protein
VTVDYFFCDSVEKFGGTDNSEQGFLQQFFNVHALLHHCATYVPNFGSSVRIEEVLEYLDKNLYWQGYDVDSHCRAVKYKKIQVDRL